MPGPPGTPGTLGKLGFGGATSDEEPPARPKAPGRPLFLGDLLAGAGSLLLFLASFLPFVSYDNAKLTTDLEKLGLSTWFTAWSGQTFMAPLTWFAVLAALGVVAISGHRYVRGNGLTVLSFSLPQLQLVFAAFPAVVLIGYAASRKSVLFGADYAALLGKAPATTAFDTRLSLSIGGYVMLVAALVAVAGAVLNVIGIERTVWPRTAKPAPVPRGAPRTDSPFYGAAVPSGGGAMHTQPVADRYGNPEQPVSGTPFGGADRPVSGHPAPGRADQYGGSPAYYGGPNQPVSGSPGRHEERPQAPGRHDQQAWPSTEKWDSAPSWETARPEPTQLYGQLPADTGEQRPAVDPLTDPSFNEQPRRNPGTVYGRPPS